MRKQLIDQSAHFAAAFVAILVAATLGGTFTVPSGALLGSALGLTREITEDGSVLSQGSLIDIIFWTLGGAAAGALL